MTYDHKRRNVRVVKTRNKEGMLVFPVILIIVTQWTLMNWSCF